jgi:hypothetical protein
MASGGFRVKPDNWAAVTAGRATPSFARWLLVSVGVALPAAVLIVPYPFMGDQSLFAVFGRMMSDGFVLVGRTEHGMWLTRRP